MGYQLQAGAPQITTTGRTFGAGAFVWSTPAGDFFKMGLFESKAGEWVELESRYTEPAALLIDIQNAGGIVNYTIAVRDYIRSLYAKYATAPGPAPGEPTTPAEACAAVSAHINALGQTVFQP